MSMQRHHLNIMTDVLHWVSFPIVAIEPWTGKPVRHFSRLDFVRKRGPRCFSQSGTHSIHGGISRPPFLWGDWIPNLILLRTWAISVLPWLLGEWSVPISSRSPWMWTVSVLTGFPRMWTTSSLPRFGLIRSLLISISLVADLSLLVISVSLLPLPTSRSTRDCPLGLVRSFSRVGHFFSLVVLPIFSFLLSALSPARPPRRSYGSVFRVTPRMPFRHFFRARVPLEPQCCRRAPRWASIVRTKDRVTGPNHYLGSQLICMVGLGILL